MSRDCTVSSIGLLWALLLAQATAGVTVPDIVQQVSEQEYRYNLNSRLYTHLGDNRGLSGLQHDLARDSIRNYLQSLNLQTSLDYHPPGTWVACTNVVATKLGKVRPQDIFIVSGHYDAYDCPGADDDASGVAAVMEIARVLAPYDFEATLVFVAFDGEEVSRAGSRGYAYDHRFDNILGMICLDQIAFNDGTNQVTISNRDRRPIQDDVAAAVLLYGSGLAPIVLSDYMWGTDNDSFASYQFNCCNLIEQVPYNSYHHGANDSVDMPGYIDYTYATNMVRSVTGYLADKAVLMPEPNTVPPAWVGDLLGKPSTSSGGVDLAWTAPADYGPGGTGRYTCVRYDLRYSADPITEANWNLATPVANPPAPEFPGSREAFTVTGLVGGNTWYFALKSVDTSNNSSEISNLAEARASILGDIILQAGSNGYTGQTDSYMVGNSSTNYGTSQTMIVRGFAGQGIGNVQRGILKFDLAGLPTNTRLTLAKIYIYTCDPALVAGDTGLYGVYPLARDWTDSQVNWTQAQAGIPWTTPGGDFLTPPDGTATKGNVAGWWYRFDVTSRVQSWLRGTSANYGWIIKCTNENLPNQDCFYTAEAGNSALRPYLRIRDLTDPVPGDIDGDGAVDVVDLLTMVYSFGGICGVDRNYDPRADLNGDKTVDVVDLLTLIENWPKT